VLRAGLTPPDGLLVRVVAAEFTTTLPSFGEGDGSEDGSESEDEDAMLASLSHEELCEMLSETRAQLAQAAEMGQALMAELQQMELLKQDNAQLQEQKEEWEATQEEHEWRIEELEECVGNSHPLISATVSACG
jgi:tRNA U34 5-carboxymethylaminomethyl modifying GTPase MnmE/TrmE